MDLIIENFRGIKQANIKLSEKITLIAGQNGSGKTSTIQALQALLTGETMPISGVKKKDAKLLVHGIEKSGRASFQYGDSKTEIKYPSCVITRPATGATLNCSRYAAGLELPANIPTKELTQIFAILPTKEDWDKEIANNEPLWNAIQKNGWDQEYSKATYLGQELKRNWEKSSGENWGSEKAASFTPEHYTGKSINELEMALRSAEKIYEHTIKSQALDEKERQDLEKFASDHENSQKSIEELSTKLADINTQLTKAQELLAVIPQAINKQQAYNCWNCNELGIIKDGKYVKAPEPTSQEDATAARLRIDEQTALIRTLQGKRDDLTLSLKEARAYSSRCEDAKRRLGSIVQDTAAPSVSTEDARAEVELCKKRLAACDIKFDCDAMHQCIVSNITLCKLLSPEGLRKQVLTKKLTSFNELLSIICETAEWSNVSLDESLDIYFGGRPYALLSTAEKLAVNITLQVALTKLDGSQIIIIDGVDILDRELRNGLINILDHIPIPSVIGCTFNTAEDVPNLDELGISYWCEFETVSQVSKTMAIA